MVEQYYTLSRKRVFEDKKGYTGMTKPNTCHLLAIYMGLT